MLPFADAHIHPAGPDFNVKYPDIAYCNLRFHCTARLSDWDPMIANREPKTVHFIGIHPWYCDEWDNDAMAKMDGLLGSDSRLHVGEIGLDSKRGSIDAQMPAFEAQLDLASEYGRMANIHMVACEKDVLDSLRRHGGRCRPILHSFSSESYVKPFAELGCMFSLNPRILARSDERIRRLVSAIPEDMMLLETDFPFVTNHFKGMTEFATRLSGIIGCTPNELISLTMDNARRIADG